MGPVPSTSSELTPEQAERLHGIKLSEELEKAKDAEKAASPDSKALKPTSEAGASPTPAGDGAAACLPRPRPPPPGRELTELARSRKAAQAWTRRTFTGSRRRRSRRIHTWLGELDLDGLDAPFSSRAMC